MPATLPPEANAKVSLPPPPVRFLTSTNVNGIGPLRAPTLGPEIVQVVSAAGPASVSLPPPPAKLTPPSAAIGPNDVPSKAPVNGLIPVTASVSAAAEP